MFCIHCGADIPGNSKYCTSCGKKTSVLELQDNKDSNLKKKSKKKTLLTILITIVITSAIWLSIYGTDITTTEEETVNIISRSLETIGRQIKAWSKTEDIISLMSYGISDECMYETGCVEEVVDSVTTLRAEIDKEGEEIDNIWNSEVFWQDLEQYFSKLEEKNQKKILDVINLYFPEESEEIQSSVTLL
jgi:predicted nucleic acid-binding Zn ribbon protein